MKIMKKIIALISLSMVLVGCVEATKEEKTTVDQVQLVSANDHTINNQPAISIYIGPASRGHLDITMRHSDFKPGYAIAVTGRESTDISISGNWDGNYYSQSSKHPTSLSFSVVSVSPTEAVIEVTARLVSTGRGSDKYFTLEKSLVKIEGEHFDNLALKNLSAGS